MTLNRRKASNRVTWLGYLSINLEVSIDLGFFSGGMAGAYLDCISGKRSRRRAKVLSFKRYFHV